MSLLCGSGEPTDGAGVGETPELCAVSAQRRHSEEKPKVLWGDALVSEERQRSASAAITKNLQIDKFQAGRQAYSAFIRLVGWVEGYQTYFWSVHTDNMNLD